MEFKKHALIGKIQDLEQDKMLFEHPSSIYVFVTIQVQLQ